jgi:uncharacterized protein YdiU (UPF0061 family)
MPLIDDQEMAMKALEPYKAEFTSQWTQRFFAKLGLAWPDDAAVENSDATATSMALIQDLLAIMSAEQTDFTLLWRRLSHAAPQTDQSHQAWHAVSDLFVNTLKFKAWQSRYMDHLQTQKNDVAVLNMLNVNPKYVLRNHLVEIAIQKSKEGDHSEVQTLFNLLQSPYSEQAEFEHYANLPPSWAADISISCSS